MNRPFPVHPRGPRRRKRAESDLLFACPRVSPEWELSALHALVKPKPQTKGPIAHRSGRQTWPPNGAAIITDVAREIRQRLHYDPVLHANADGDYLLVARVAPDCLAEGRALAAALSARLPSLWFVFGRLFVHAGRFYRRERGFKLNLVEATNVHLPRRVRTAMRGLI
jgi:hypothetical protein